MDLDIKLLTDRMDQRLAQLEDLLYRDYMGGTNLLEAYRELKQWRESIERGDFKRVMD